MTIYTYPGLETTPQMIAQLTLDRLGILLNGEGKRARESAVVLVMTNTYALQRLGEIARGETAKTDEEAEG